jgi:pilus assembly protein CpaB
MRIVILGLAVGSAVFAGVLAKNFIGKRPQAEIVEINQVKMVEVLVAMKDIQMGERLADTSIAWKEWPASNVGPTMITRADKPDARETYQSSRARLAIFEGEPIADKKLVIPGQAGFMSAILPKGMRAISVAISERSAAGGFILPNDRVDVILTRKLDDPNSNQKVVKSEIVLTNVRVLAINQTYRQETTEEKVTVTEGKTATLELDPRQTEVISMVESAGELSLALRSIAENGDKGMEEGGPRLSERFTRTGPTGSERLFVRYGIETLSSSR